MNPLPALKTAVKLLTALTELHKTIIFIKTPDTPSLYEIVESQLAERRADEITRRQSLRKGKDPTDADP
jgi:hypothetical protein